MARRATRLLGLTLLLVAVQLLLGVASAVAGPIGMVCTTGPTFNLVARAGQAETPDGNSIRMWSYAIDDALPATPAFQEPGPVLCVNQGDMVTVNLRNALAEPVSIIFPGQQGVSPAGAPPLFAAEAAPGGTATYTFQASQPGTYLYESGSNQTKQVEMGMYGALVVRPSMGPNFAYNDATTQFDPAREYILVFNEIDPVLHHAVEVGGNYDFNKLHNRYFTVNGREFPDTIQDNGVSWLPTQPYGALVRVQPYNATTNALPALIRMVNAGELNHPYHPHGNHLRLIAQDGRLQASSEHFAETIASGQTLDLLFRWTDQDGWDPTSKPIPAPVPTYRNLMFKDGQTWFSGSAYLGRKGTLPTGVVSYNVCGEYYFPWHSHALNEFTNFDEGFGGMATLLRVDPLGGCTAYPNSTKISTSPAGGTLRAGSYTALGVSDNVYYQVNSTTTGTTRTTDWYGGFTGVATGSANLTVTYEGHNNNNPNTGSPPPLPTSLWAWKWTAPAGWVQLGAGTTVGAADTTITRPFSSASPATPLSAFIGTGAYKGQVRVRVLTTRTAPAANFFTSGDLMKLTYDAP
jgi:hypothetical protein